MTTTTAVFVLGSVTASTGAAAIAEAAADGSLTGWFLGAIVGLAGFIGVVFRGLQVRQDKLHDETSKAAAEREKRMQDRADEQQKLNETQITTLAAISTHLGNLDHRLDAARCRVDDIERRKGT